MHIGFVQRYVKGTEVWLIYFLLNHIFGFYNDTKNRCNYDVFMMIMPKYFTCMPSTPVLIAYP